MPEKAIRWSRNPEDTGGYICMPLVKNVPNGRPDWTRSTCPKCGAACWRRPSQEPLEKAGYTALCTVCALKKID